jgi:hypothetical protein
LTDTVRGITQTLPGTERVTEVTEVTAAIVSYTTTIPAIVTNTITNNVTVIP